MFNRPAPPVPLEPGAPGGAEDRRMDALEARMDRAEDSASARVLIITGKLDALAATLAKGFGSIRATHWVGVALLAVSGFVFHFLIQYFGTHGQ